MTRFPATPTNEQALTLSLSSGATDTPLIEQTLGVCFDAMADAQPDHEALVSAHQSLRTSYRALQTTSNHRVRTTWYERQGHGVPVHVQAGQHTHVLVLGTHDTLSAIVVRKECEAIISFTSSPVLHTEGRASVSL